MRAATRLLRRRPAPKHVRQAAAIKTFDDQFDYLREILNSRVYDAAVETPLQHAAKLSSITNCDAYVKREDLQPVFSFKIRGAYNRIVYRFRPHENRSDRALMDVLYLAPYRGRKPANATRRWLDLDEPWTEAPELGGLARVFDQDTFNLGRVQAGLEAASHTHVTFAQYQETKLRHFHSLLDTYVGDE